MTKWRLMLGLGLACLTPVVVLVAANGTRVGQLTGQWVIVDAVYPTPMSYMMARSNIGRKVTIEPDGSLHGEFYYLTALIAPRSLFADSYFIHETASNERYKARLNGPSELHVVGLNGAFIKLKKVAGSS